VSVETPITIAQDFRRIAKIVGIPGWDEKATDIFTLVRNWFKDESNGPWTMVLDNVDDAHVLTAPAPRVTSLVEDEHDVPVPQIREFFTTSSRGSILVTSRNTEAAQMITGNCAHHIDIEEMNETEAITLLKSKLNTRVIYTPSEASELVGAVDYMPLAISQIATNISINYPRLTLSKAIAQINAPSEDTARLLETSVHETSRDIRRSNSIVKTWHLSFQYVRETNPSAARLLSLMCLFDRQGIPEALLTGQYGEDITAVGAPLQPHLNWWKRIRRRRLRFRRRKRAGDLKTAAATTNTKGKNANFDNDWKVLTNFALIKTNIDGCHFNMHRLVQHTTKRWLEINGELRAWLTKYIHLIRDYFPARPDYDNWRLCQYLFPHAQQCIAYKPATDHEALNAWAPLMFSVATHANDIRNYKAAETLSRAVFELFNDSFGKENIQTLESAQQLGEALEHSQRHSEAEAMYKWTLAGRQKVLGQDHNVTLHTLNCLGRVLQAQNKMEEGDEVYKQRLDAKEKALGAADPSTQFSVSIAAFDFSSRGMFKEAEELQRKQIQNTCGKLSESDMYQMTTLASTLKMQAKYDEAETLYRRVLDERLEKGPNAAAFKIMVRIGELYEMQQRVSQAEEQYRQAAAAFAELCTPGHADTLETQERLALVLAQQQRYAEAEAFARHILLTRERAVGKQDRDTLIGAHTLAEILDQRGRYQDALPLFERAYVETEKLLGASHPDTIEFLNDYNRVKSKQQEWAQEYGDTCAGAEESHGQELGTDHLSTTESVNSVDIANDRQMNCVQEHDSVRGMEKTSFGQQQQQLGLVSPIMSAQPIAL
jgi:tetratricopeptide (TPR) repeat protein